MMKVIDLETGDYPFELMESHEPLNEENLWKERRWE